MADQASSGGGDNFVSAAPENPTPAPAPGAGMEALMAQQTALMQVLVQQVKDLNKRVEVAEEVAAKAVSQSGETAQSGDAELEALKKLLYVPHVAENPFPAQPATLETDMPQMYDLYNDKTHATLSKRTNSSMRYEQLVLAPALSYMHDAIAYAEATMDWMQDEKDPPNFEELGERVYTAHNTFKGVFALLSNRYTMIQLRASMESDATVHGGTEALRAKLAFVEEKVYTGTEGLEERAKASRAAELVQKVADAALVKAGGDQGLGVAPKPRPNFPHAESLGVFRPSRRPAKRPHPAGKDATPQQLEWMSAETERSLKQGDVGAWVLPYMDDFLVLVSNKMEALRVVRLYCANQAVLSHFTSRNPELMRRMRRLWILLDLDDIELQASYIKSEANEWPDRLSRYRDLDDWRLNRRWFLWAKAEWHRHTVDRFASELSAQLSRYYAQWYDTGCEGVDSLAYSWRGEVNWVNPPWSLLDEVAHKLREERVRVYWPIDNAWYSGTVGDTEDGLTHAYDDGDEERLDMSKERYKVLVVKPQVVAGWGAALHECWRVERGQSSHTELAVQMQSAALDSKTVGNYRPKAKAFIDFCDSEGCQWLPATEATVLLYIAHLLAKGTVRAASMQPYLSAINNYHEDMGFPGPAKVNEYGLQLRPVGRSGTELLIACAFVVFAFVTFGRPDTRPCGGRLCCVTGLGTLLGAYSSLDTGASFGDSAMPLIATRFTLTTLWWMHAQDASSVECLGDSLVEARPRCLQCGVPWQLSGGCTPKVPPVLSALVIRWWMHAQDPNSFIELVVFGAMLTAFFVFLRKDNVLVEKADAWNPRGHLVRSDASFPVADDGSRRAEVKARHSKTI
eukprot:gene9885-biopygen10105